MKLFKIIFMVAVCFMVTATGYAQEGKVQLQWKNAEDAVMYELEVTIGPIRTNKAASNKQTVIERQIFLHRVQN